VVACIVAVQSRRALLTGSGCVALAEYRLDDLARISGVSARNIRAYRERGLLDPPRRVGRSAYYDDYHLSQLKTINQTAPQGVQLRPYRGVFREHAPRRRSVRHLGHSASHSGPRTDEGGEGPVSSSDGPAGGIDPNCDEARALIDYGLAELVDGEVVLVDRAMGAIVARAADPMLYLRVILADVRLDAGVDRQLGRRFRPRAEGAVHSAIRSEACAQARGDGRTEPNRA